MLSVSRFSRGGVLGRIVGLSILAAVAFISGCATNGSGAPQFTVTTTSGQLATVTVNSVYPGTTLTAANGTAPYAWTMTSGTLPTGMTLSSAGMLSGTPTQSGAFTFTVTVKDSANPAHTATASLTLAVNQAPAVTSANQTTFTAGSSGSFTVTASGYPAPTFSETGALPTGVTLNSTTGVLGGTPASGTGGTYTITITAQNGTSPNATQSFTLTVDQAAAITSGGSTSITVGTSGTFTVTATGFPAPTLSESGTLPTGVMFNTTTGVLSGTPGNGTQGSYPIMFTAHNGVGADATQNFTLTVGLIPAITSGSSTTFTVGTAGNFTVAATGFPAPTFSETGLLPSGVNLNSTTGVLSGTPAAGTGKVYSITITAQNSVGTSPIQSFTLTVDQAPAITSGTSTTFTVGTAGSFTVAATGFPAPTFSEVGGLPTGVSLNSSTGVLSGTPATGTQGSYPITITAQNGVSPNSTQNFTLTVGLAPTITSGNSTTFTVGTAGSFTVAATGFPAPTFNESGALPQGVNFNTATGVLSGTPATGAGKVYSITFTAQNGTTPNNTQNFTLTVDEAPSIISANNATFTVGTFGSFTEMTTGFPHPVLGCCNQALPSGVTFVDNGDGTGTLSGTPQQGTAGVYSLRFTAINNVGSNASQIFTLTVNTAPVFTSVTNTTFTVGTAGSFTVTASGTPSPTLSESGALPQGVNFNTATGVLSGTPAAGTGKVYSITFTAQNGITPNGTQNFTLTVDEAPSIISANNATFTVGTFGSFTEMTTGFPHPVLGCCNQALPSGVTFVDNGDGTGTLSGTPQLGSSGVYSLRFTAINNVGSNASQIFTLTVNTAPVFTSSSSTTFTVGGAGTFSVTTSGSPTPTLTESGTLPSGVTFTDNGGGNGTLAGTPATGTGGTYSFTIKAQSSSGTTSQSFTLTVDEAPSFTSSNNTTFTVAEAGTFGVNTSGFPSPSITDGGATLPSGVTFTDNGNGSGTLAGTPATGTAGNYSITFTASNSIGSNATQSFTLTVITDPCATAGTGSEGLLSGSYAFVLKGFDNGADGIETGPEPALVGGVLTFNGSGLISAGTMDMNLDSGVQSGLTVTAGSYKIGSDHRACMTITTSAGTQHYRATLAKISGGVASTGHMINFDTGGPFTTGVLRKQSAPIPTTLSGKFAFGVSSPQNTSSCQNSLCGGNFGAVGVFTVSSNGSFTEIVDFNTNGYADGSTTAGTGFLSAPISITGGAYNIFSNGRGPLAFTPPGGSLVNTEIYVVSSSEILIMDLDPQTSNSIFAGEALLQAGAPFSANPLSGNYVGYQSGMDSPTGPSRTTLLLITPSGVNLSGTQLRNDGGSFQSKSLSGVTYSVASSGRVTITGGTPSPIFYLVSTSQAFFLEGGNTVDTGLFQSQTSTSASGTYAFGTVDPQISNSSYSSGVATFAAPNVNVTEDDNGNGSQQVDQMQSFSFSTNSTGLGEVWQSPQTGCTISATSTTCQTVFYVISPTKAVVMDVGSSNPKIQLADQ